MRSTGITSLEIGPGDEVITTPFTFCYAEVISAVGATPVFVDQTFNIDRSKW